MRVRSFPRNRCHRPRDIGSGEKFYPREGSAETEEQGGVIYSVRNDEKLISTSRRRKLVQPFNH